MYRSQKGLVLLAAIATAIQMRLDQGHSLGRVSAYKRDLGKMIEMVKALPATDLVRARCDDFVNYLF